jgi:hypothetical protein
LLESVHEYLQASPDSTATRPADIISYAVWLYYRFNLSHRDIEDLLAERGITVSYETVRLWCIKFGAKYARRLKRKHHGYGNTFYREVNLSIPTPFILTILSQHNVEANFHDRRRTSAG